MKKILSILSVCFLLVAACKKADFNDNSVTGEGLVDFSLQTPSSGAKIGLNAATPAASVVFTWNAAKPGLITSPKYKVVMALRTGGDLANPLVQFDADNSGAAAKLTLTYQQLDDALKAKSIADGATTELIWSVKADNGSKQVMAQNNFFLTVTRFKDGASPFFLLGPVSSMTAQSINPNATAEFFTFNWTRSKPAAGGAPIRYKVLFAERKTDANGIELPVDWSTPLFSIISDNGGADSLAKVSYKALSDSMFKYGLTNLPNPASLKWTVVATSGTWSQRSDYVNDLVIIREVKIFIVGSATPNGWDASKAIRMIPDNVNFGVFYMYVQLSAGELKFLNGQAFPPTPGAVDWGQNPSLPSGNLTADGESNIPVATAGVYRITFDLNNLKFYLQTGRMATVGGGTPAGWTPSAVFPAQGLTYIGVDKFLGIVPFSGGGEFKFIDSDSWPSGGGPVNQTRDFGKGSADGILVEAGENNINGPAAGNGRVIWDGSDPLNLKYSLTPATMYLIGDATAGGWDNNASNPNIPPMTYMGNGLWRATNVTLTAGKEFKFIFIKGSWDYNYGGTADNDNPMASGAIKEGGGNIRVGAGGNYTVEINEYTRTYRVF